jgi:NAD(P) transhydrogenase subunit alpha
MGKAALDAAVEFGHALPMITAARTIKTLGARNGSGVAGLQAIATARRLGAIVSTTDVRAAARQVEASANFITVDEEAMNGRDLGRLCQMDEGFQRRQRERSPRPCAVPTSSSARLGRDRRRS